MEENKKRIVASALSILFAMTIITSGVLPPAAGDTRSETLSVVGENTSALG